MARNINEDLDVLLKFLSVYSLDGILRDEQLKSIIKSFHKYHLSYLTLLVCMEQKTTFSDPMKDRLFESASDIGYAFFLLCNGCYKPANLILRSSLENFVKALVVNNNPNILQEKFIHKIFSEACTVQQCTYLTEHQSIKSLYGYYKELCKYTHTSSEQEMSQMIAFKWLPGIDYTEANKLRNIARNILKKYILIVIHLFRDEFFEIDFQHKDTIFVGVSSKDQKRIHEGCH